MNEEEKKFQLSDASPEDVTAFQKGMDELLEKLSLAVTLVINKRGVSIKLENGEIVNSFVDQPTLLVQKKTEVEVLKTEPIPSTDPEINPQA